MLNTPRRAGGAVAAGGSGSQGVTVVLEVRAGDNSAYSRFLADELRKYVRTSAGGNVQTAFGSGKYRNDNGRPINLS
jgi:hypothetical protein